MRRHGDSDSFGFQSPAKLSRQKGSVLRMSSLDRIKETPADKVKFDLEAFSAKRGCFPKEAMLEDLVENGAVFDFVYGIRFRHLIGDIFFFKNDMVVYSQVFPQNHRDLNVIKVLNISLDEDHCHLLARIGGRVIRGDMKDGTEVEAVISAIDADDKENLRLLKNWNTYQSQNSKVLSGFYSDELKHMGLSEVRA